LLKTVFFQKNFVTISRVWWTERELNPELFTKSSLKPLFSILFGLQNLLSSDVI